MPDISKGQILCCGPFFFTAAAFILSQIASKRCYYVNFPPGTEHYVRRALESAGFWCATNIGGTSTVSYRDESFDKFFDSTFLAARGLTIATTAIGAVVIIASFFAPCFNCGGKLFFCLGLLLFVNCILEGCTFIILRSETVCTCTSTIPEASDCACELGIGGKCGIAATVLWFVASLLTCATGTADTGEKGDDD